VFIKGDLAYPETDVWVVTNVGMKQTAEWVADRQKAHERWRKVTDV
jgi:cellulose synthase/poly-beta-1,6-N-acetylglucosamine synthase-like glycosyltransferase